MHTCTECSKIARTKCCHRRMCNSCWLKYFHPKRKDRKIRKCTLCGDSMMCINKSFTPCPDVMISKGYMKGYRCKLLQLVNYRCLVDVEAKNKKIWMSIDKISFL
jgi:hypothetical protein